MRYRDLTSLAIYSNHFLNPVLLYCHIPMYLVLLILKTFLVWFLALSTAGLVSSFLRCGKSVANYPSFQILFHFFKFCSVSTFQMFILFSPFALYDTPISENRIFFL